MSNHAEQYIIVHANDKGQMILAGDGNIFSSIGAAQDYLINPHFSDGTYKILKVVAEGKVQKVVKWK